MPKQRSSIPRATSVVIRQASTAMKAHEAMGAAANVIAARTEMAALAVANPTAETGAEMNLMVTEKIAAFTEAGAALSAGVQAMAGQGARYAAQETAAAGKAMAALSACRTPAELAMVQGRLIVDFWSRGLSYGMGLNTLASRTGDKALAPVHKAVVANDRRLRKPR